MQAKTWERLFERVDHLDHSTLVSLVKKFYRQKEIFEKVVDVIRDGIVMVECDGRVILANDSAEKILNVRGLRSMIFWKCVPELIQ
jgi:PAS domain-containing protein